MTLFWIQSWRQSLRCLKDKAPPLNFEHSIIIQDISSSVSFRQLFPFTPRFCIAVWSYNKTSGHLIFCIFTYLHVWNLTSVSYFILHIHTTRYTSKGKEAACPQAHQMQTAPIISSADKLLPSHSVLNLTALENHLHVPSFTSALTEVLAIKDCNYLRPSWGQVIDIGKPRAQILFPKA